MAKESNINEKLNSSERDFIFNKEGISKDELNKENVDLASSEAKEELFMQSIFEKQTDELGVKNEQETSIDIAGDTENILPQNESEGEITSRENATVDSIEPTIGFWQSASTKIKQLFSKENEDINALRSNHYEQETEERRENNGLESGGNSSEGDLLKESEKLSLKEPETVFAEKMNEAPGDILVSDNNVDENSIPGTVVATLSAIDEDGRDTHTFSMLENDNFEIDGSEIKVKAGVDLNFESDESHDVEVTVTDSEGNTYTRTVSIAVNNLNEDPTDIALSASSVDENSAAGTVVVNLVSTDEDAGETFTYAIANNDNFIIEGNQIKVKSGADLDFESNESHDVVITVTDSAGNTFSKTVSLAINNLNEKPTDITLSVSSVNENSAAGIVVAKLSATDEDSGERFSYSMVNNGNFEVVGNQIKVKDGADLNFESAESHKVEITVTDSAGNTYTETVKLTVNNINEKPTDITLSNSAIDENSKEGTVVAKLSATDEDSGEMFSYSMANNDNFEIVDSQIKVKAGADLDFESAEAHKVEITVKDSAGNTYTETVKLSVNNLNEDPTDITLSNSAIDENSKEGTVVAKLSTIDEGSGETFSYSMANNDNFEVIGNQIKVKAGADLDFESAEA
ncbi:MAG: cadherin repeat domain-containing protein, partial [Methylococcales bacterium]|nr:cadherin repeat domain-containing protein [Methylococcales bacterium]